MPLDYYSLDGARISSAAEALVKGALEPEIEARSGQEYPESPLMLSVSLVRNSVDFIKEKDKVRIDRNQTDVDEIWFKLKGQLDEFYLQMKEKGIPWKSQVGALILVVDLNLKGNQASLQQLQYLNDSYVKDFRAKSPLYKQGSTQSFPLKYWYVTTFFQAPQAELEIQSTLMSFNDTQISIIKKQILEDNILSQTNLAGSTIESAQGSQEVVYQVEIAELGKQIQNLTMENQNILGYQTLLQEQVSSLSLENQKCLEQYQQAKQELETVQQTFEQEKQKFIAESNQRVAELENDCNSFYSELLLQRDKTIENNAQEMKAVLENHQSQIQSLTSEHNQQIERIQNEYKQHYEQLLTEETTGKTKETQILSAVIEEQKQRIAYLENLNQTSIAELKQAAELDGQQKHNAYQKQIDEFQSKQKIAQRSLKKQKDLVSSLTQQLEIAKQQQADNAAELANLRSVLIESKDSNLAAVKEHETKIAECGQKLATIMGEKKIQSKQLRQFESQKQCPNLLLECQTEKDNLKGQVQELTKQYLTVTAANRELAQEVERFAAEWPTSEDWIPRPEHEVLMASLQEERDRFKTRVEDLVEESEQAAIQMRDLRKQLNAQITMQNLQSQTPIQAPTSPRPSRTTTPDQSERIQSLETELFDANNSIRKMTTEHQNAMEALKSQTAERVKEVLADSVDLQTRITELRREHERCQLQYNQLTEEYQKLKLENEEIWSDKQNIYKERLRTAEAEILSLQGLLEKSKTDLNTTAEILDQQCEERISDRVAANAEYWQTESRKAFDILDKKHTADIEAIQDAFDKCQATTSRLETELTSTKQQLTASANQEAQDLTQLSQSLESQLQTCRQELTTDQAQFAEHKRRQIETEKNLVDYYSKIIDNHNTEIATLQSNISECQNKSAACLAGIK